MKRNFFWDGGHWRRLVMTIYQPLPKSWSWIAIYFWPEISIYLCKRYINYLDNISSKNTKLKHIHSNGFLLRWVIPNTNIHHITIEVSPSPWPISASTSLTIVQAAPYFVEDKQQLVQHWIETCLFEWVFDFGDIFQVVGFSSYHYWWLIKILTHLCIYISKIVQADHTLLKVNNSFYNSG